jgi:hypothetical protein
MFRCLHCSREMVAEYDSQICAYCAGELPRPGRQRRLSVRRFLIRLKDLVGRGSARAGATPS